MSNVSSPPSQASCELPKDPDRHIEKAKEIFRKARADKENKRKFKRLLKLRTPKEEREKVTLPLFRELTSLIAGREDLELPQGDDYFYFKSFDILLNLSEHQSNESSSEEDNSEDTAIRLLIDHISAEVEKADKMKSNRWTNVARSVKQAWETDYVGETDKLLREAVFSMYRGSRNKPYGNFCAIIQGSGAGKSRVVDKLAESVFTIPITLRPLCDTEGFPLGDSTGPDTALVEFFCQTKYFKSALHAQLSYLQFLLKTLVIADEWIDDYKTSGRRIENIAAEWRKHLGAPRTPRRRDMYGRAIGPSSLEGFEDILDETIDFDLLQGRVRKFIKQISQKIKPPTGEEPMILFYFDEAQHLTAFTVTKEGIEPRRSAYQCLCKAFTYMLNVPVFALFLSAYSRLFEFSPSARNFWSSRLLSLTSKENDDNLNAPFVELPFDVWKAHILVTEGSHSADEICSLRFMARFGRPMFWATLETMENDETSMIELAMSKLELRLEDPARLKTSNYQCKELIPLLAARVDFTFESNRDEAVALEGLLVASSMRTVYSIPQYRQYLRGGYPSEPFLAEAAARATLAYFQSVLPKKDQDDVASIITKYKDVVPEAVSAWFDQGLIDKGPRGELVARLLCTLAHDISILKKVTPAEKLGDVSFSQMVPVVDFLRTLISGEHIDKVFEAQPQNTTGKLLKEVFENAYVHFTQFVKAGDGSAMTEEAAYLFFTRGAAIQGYGNMRDVDLVIPVWIRGDGNPDRKSMTAIFIQVKNRKAKQIIQIDVQKSHEFFTGNVKRPYITIAMQLGLDDNTKSKHLPVVNVSPPRSKKSQNKQGKHPLHPRYEIFINGCSSEAYGVISGTRNTYSSLLTDKDIFSEHPRSGGFLAAVRRMKPTWAKISYDWAHMIWNTRFEDQPREPGEPKEKEEGHVESDGERERDNNRLSTGLSKLRITS